MINIYDLHNDYFTTLKHIKQKQSYVNRSKKQGLFNMISAVWTTNMNECHAIETLQQAKAFCDKNGLNLAIEDCHFITHENIHEIIKLKPIYMGLTWNYLNNIACGALDYGGLTKFGQEVVDYIEKNNIQIDTAHLNEASFLSFSNTTQKPILCSHTAVNAICNNPRNLKDYQIKIIEESNGLIGLCLVSNFISNNKTADINDVVKHIDYIASRFSIDIISLGTDFYGTTNIVKGLSDYLSLKKLQNRLEILGYSSDAIEKIFFANAQRFFAN